MIDLSFDDFVKRVLNKDSVSRFYFNYTFSWNIESSVKFCLELKKANLSKANLSEANLSWANLSKANLSWANLSKANLSEANLSWANLSEANLSWANLSEANLSWANLSEANLSKANLSKANLSKANLSEANLSKADLSKANLSEANLSKTYLSPITLREWIKNHKIEIGKFGNLILYKKVNKNLTSSYDKKTKYIVGKETSCEICNGDIMQDCGNGLHVSSLEFAKNFSVSNGVIIEVLVSPFDIVAIPVNGEGKIRVKMLKVVKVVK